MPFTLRAFKKLVQLNKIGMRSFLTKTENNPPKKLDNMIDEIDREVWAETACLSCANCCKTMSPTYNNKDLKRISSHMQMTVQEFKDKWLYWDKKEGDWMNKLRPCQFLDLTTNMCTIYEIRPADCAGFPHLTKKKMTDYMHIHRQNIQYCPATYKMVEKLKQRIVLSKIKIKKLPTKNV
jgi:uncharacterized protein